MDITEARQRQLITEMPRKLVAELEAGRPVWDHVEAPEVFTFLWFAAPIVGVVKKDTGERGSIMFTHSPRYYFGWEPEGKR